MKFPIPEATKDGYILMEVGGVCDLSYPDSNTRRGRVQENGTICPAILANQGELVKVEIYAIQ